MKVAIAPSVLSFSHADLRESVVEMEAAGAAAIHLDVMDGRFVPPLTFGDGLAQSVRGMVGIPVEAHLMIVEPERQVEAFARAGCNRLIFHGEATAHSHRLVQHIHSLGLEAGVAINPGTAVATIQPLLGFVDLVLVMTVNPGWGGQSFLESTLSKIEQVRSLDPKVEIEVDGGITPATIKAAREAGATFFVVGSYLQKEATIAEAFKKLDRACD